MTWRKFKDDEKQFLGLSVHCKNNPDGTHSEKNVLMVLHKLRNHSKLENGSSVSNSKSDNYIATTIKCYEKEVDDQVKIVKEIEEIDSIEVGEHDSWIELQERCKKFEEDEKKPRKTVSRNCEK